MSSKELIFHTDDRIHHIRTGERVMLFTVEGLSPTKKRITMKFASDRQGFNAMRFIRVESPRYYATLANNTREEFRMEKGN